MSRKESLVRDSSGKVTHVRSTSEDGKSSTLYRANEGIDVLISGIKGSPVEVAEHRSDGTTKAFEADTSIIGVLFHGGKGKGKG